MKLTGENLLFYTREDGQILEGDKPPDKVVLNLDEAEIPMKIQQVGCLLFLQDLTSF